MRLSLTNKQFTSIIGSEKVIGEGNFFINNIVYDTRRINYLSEKGNESVFFALKGGNTDGHDFVEDAYQKGIRVFVLSFVPEGFDYQDVYIFLVKDTFEALYQLAFYQRNQLRGKVVLVSGKIGKTTVKEWLYYLLSPEMKVSRSPKSYNSNLGILLSLLEFSTDSDVCIVEVKPHEELNPNKINQLLQPNIGVLTTSNKDGFVYSENYFESLFSDCLVILHAEKQYDFNRQFITNKKVNLLKKDLFNSDVKRKNASLAYAVALELGIEKNVLESKLASLPELALRMETFEGKNGNFIINDLYSVDYDAFKSALEFQQSISKGKKRAVVLSLNQEDEIPELVPLIEDFKPDFYFFLNKDDVSKINDLTDTVILIKGNVSKNLLRLVNQLKIKRHHTFLRINLKSLKKNIQQHKKVLPKGTKLMAMMKASGYGSGLDKMAQFVDSFGVDYFGVAFVDEGVEIRNAGITKPIMIMNVEDYNYESCIQYQLEPAIFDFQQLDDFISECIYQGVWDYPIHLKVDTGMNRLGFSIDEIDKVLEVLQSQPEVRIKSVYSHLADADNIRDKRFTEHQIKLFSLVVSKIQKRVPYTFDHHLLNSAGIENFSKVNFSMVRLGIGMYGVSSNPEFKRKLEPVLSWYSVVSQIKLVKSGQSIGYSRTHFCEKETVVATIPVGYADGLRRILSNGVGYLSINGVKCSIIGRVCMDMVMVDATNANAKVGDLVEIIGENCTLEKMAELQKTIPYEVMTSISQRVHKIYTQQ